jgi:hypothetical protein
MPKGILILVLLFTPKMFLVAQKSFEPSTYIGIHGGSNLSRVYFNPIVSQDMLSSLNFGLVFRHVSQPHVGLQIEVNAAGKGWKETLEDSIGTYKRKLETIDIPMMAVFIAGSKAVRYAFTLGPYVSYLRHEKETINIADTLDYRPYYLKPLENNWEFGFTGGLAVEYHTKLGVFALRASYSHSLSNLFPLNVDEYYFAGSRNQVINLGVSYYIRL